MAKVKSKPDAPESNTQSVGPAANGGIRPEERDESVPQGQMIVRPNNCPTDLAAPGTKPYTNWIIKDSKGAAQFLRAINSPALKSGDVINTLFPIRHFLIHWIEVIDRNTGEVIPCPRTVLVQPDGKTAGFVSIGIYQSMQWLFRLFGPGPYIPSIPAVVKQKPTAEGRSLLYLDLDDSQEMPSLTSWATTSKSPNPAS